MQKYFIFFLIIISTISLYADNQDYNKLFEEANKNFESKKYTKSYDQYQYLYRKGVVSKKSLLKMAYIKEALGDYTQALYFLNIYQEKYFDKKIQNKIEIMGAQYSLTGYEKSDLSFFSELYKQYYLQILTILVGVIILYFLSVVTNQIVIKGLSSSNILFFVCFSVAIMYFINTGDQYLKAKKMVVTQSPALIMSDPSAGSSCLGKLPLGTRVMVIDQKDIWYRLILQDKEVYVRKSNFDI